jgi:MFS family permease
VRRDQWLTRNLIVLTFVSLAQDAASELLYPLLPVLLVGVLAAPPVVLGLVEGLADATAGVTRFFAGKASDRRGRKRFVGAGYGLAAVGKAIVAAATRWPLVLLGRVVDRFGKGMRSAPRDALIASSVPPAARGRAFGFHRTGDTLGAVIGPLLGLAALALMHHHLRAVLWWAVVPACISAALVVLVRDSPVEAAPGSKAAAARATAPLPRRFTLLAVVLGVVALLNFSDVLVLLRVHDLGFDATHVVLAYVVFNTVYMLGSYPAGVMTDRWPRHRVYATGLAMFAAGYLWLGLLHHSGWVYVAMAVYGLFPAFTDGVGKAWIASLVPNEQLGHAQGVFQALNSGAVLVAGLWAGLVWSTGAGKGQVPLLVSGAGGIVAALVVATVVGRRLSRAAR